MTTVLHLKAIQAKACKSPSLQAPEPKSPSLSGLDGMREAKTISWQWLRRAAQWRGHEKLRIQNFGLAVWRCGTDQIQEVDVESRWDGLWMRMWM